MKSLLLLIAFATSFSVACCQQGREKTMEEFKKLAEKYKSLPYLSFNIEYNYAAADQPEESIEKLTGMFQVNGSRFQYAIANTRMIYDGEMAVVFYNDDSIMYLSKSSSSFINNPVAGLDSTLNIQGYEFSVIEDDKKSVITMHSQDTSKIKQITYEINKASGLLEKMVQTINNRYMYEHPQQTHEDDTNGYAVISTIFSNYSTKPFDTEIFLTNKYFTQVNGKYQPVYPYQSYTVFNANSGL